LRPEFVVPFVETRTRTEKPLSNVLSGDRSAVNPGTVIVFYAFQPLGRS
jgi:hypothetical protein